MGFNLNNERRGKHAAPSSDSASSVGYPQNAQQQAGSSQPESSHAQGQGASYSQLSGYHLPLVSPTSAADAPQQGEAGAQSYCGNAQFGHSASGAYSGFGQDGNALPDATRLGGGAVASRGTLPQSRSNSAAYKATARRGRKKGKRIAQIVGAVLLVLVLAGVGYGIWFANALNSAFSTGEENMSDVLTPVNDGEPFYMLVLGSDSREGSGTSSKAAESGDNQRSDVMILLRVDAANKKVTMVSIPRDTPYRTSDGSLVKINEAYNIGGAAESVKAVSQLTGVGISHYAEVHFSELESIVDKLGGVDVNVDIQLSYTDALTGETVTLQPGKQTLNGQQAQLFARARHEYQTDQDKHRQDNVRQLALAIVNKVLEKPLYQMPQALLDVAGFVGTDMRTGDIISLAMAFSGGSGSMTVYSASGPSSGAINEESGGLWLCYENPEGWAKLMKAVDAGEDPSGLDLESTAIIP